MNESRVTHATRRPACYPYPCLQSDIFVVCFTVSEPVRQDCVFGVSVVSRMPCKSDGEVKCCTIRVLTRLWLYLVLHCYRGYALREKKHTSFYTEHKLCKSAVFFFSPECRHDAVNANKDEKGCLNVLA